MVRSRFWKQHTWNRKPLDPSLKWAATLRHLNSGTKYSDMQYSWRIAMKTLSIVVREVCNALCEEYFDEVIPPYLKNGNYWQMVSTRSGTFLNYVATIDDKHIAIVLSVWERPDAVIILSGSFGWLWKHAQSCAMVCKYAFLIAKGDKYCYATQRILANNSNRSSHFVTQSQLIVLSLFFKLYNTFSTTFVQNSPYWHLYPIR